VAKRIAFIGAGSFIFTRNLVKDLFTFDSFKDAEIVLMDINPDRLEEIAKACEKIRAVFGVPAKIIKTQNRAEALQGADGVVCTVFNGGVDVWRYEIEIPKAFGVDINIGDTRSVSGIFRALRNIPLMLDICADIAKYCPNAVFLNYTNPMAMLCKAMQTHTKVNVTGLCHSVQKTVEMLADWLGATMSEVSYRCAGVNHQAFYLDFQINGQNAYPLLRQKLADPEYYNREIVRNELFLKLGYYVTESSGHNSEYCPWFRKRQDLIEKYCTHGTEWNPGLYAFSLNYHINKAANWKDEIEKWITEEEVTTERGDEYAANIFNACFGDHTPYQFNANVINNGSVSNLPKDACVEVPSLATRSGVLRTVVGELPRHLAIMVGHTAEMESLVVEAAMEKNKQKVRQAVYMDPLSSAVCSLQEIDDMVDAIFEKNVAYLGDYK
jgi:alpha-galactosidase